MTKGWKNESLRHSLSARKIKTRQKKPKQAESSEKKYYVDVYYDDEFDPPSWVWRVYSIEADGSLMVVDADLTDTKKQAKQTAKEISEKKGYELVK